MPYLVKEKDGRMFLKDVELLKDPKKLRGLFHDIRWKILELLAEKPTHPSEIAKILGEHEQKIYYHIRQLENLGLIKLHKKVEMKGTVAKIYAPTKYAFALELPYGEEYSLESPFIKKEEHISKFFYPHIFSGKLNSTIVVGSPDPHGPYQVRARDSHYAVDLAHFLGQHSSHPQEEFVVKLDVDVKAEKDYNKNLILIGGVLTNIITLEINRYLPIKFDMDSFPFRRLVSEFTNNSYSQENCGLIAKIPNPYDSEKSIIVLAGIRYSGTKAAVLGITKFHKEVLKDYDSEDSWARVVEGLDLNGDGKIDSVKVLE